MPKTPLGNYDTVVVFYLGIVIAHSIGVGILKKISCKKQ
jgi:hypothetical protein